MSLSDTAGPIVRSGAFSDMPPTVILTGSAIISGAGYVSTLILDISAAWSFSPLILLSFGAIVVPAIVRAAGDYRRSAPGPALLPPSTEEFTVVLRQDTQDGPRLEYTSDPGVTLKAVDLYNIALHVINGGAFSKDNSRLMRISQPKYKLFYDWFLENKLTRYRGATYHRGVTFTSRGRSLLVFAVKRRQASRLPSG